MAIQSLKSLWNSIVAGGHAPIIENVATDEATIGPGRAVVEDTLPNVNIAPNFDYTLNTLAGKGCHGVVMEVDTIDLDSLFPAATNFKIVKLGSGTKVRMLVTKNSTAIKAGDKMFMSKSVAGTIQPFIDIPATPATPTVLENANMQQGFIGIAQTALANTAADETWLEVMI